MLNLQQRIEILTQLQKYITGSDAGWLSTKKEAAARNPWFIPAFIDFSIQNIASRFLEPVALNKWVAMYDIPAENGNPVNIGVTMAGNIPLVGFHDFLCSFITGHKQTIKLSSKDNLLLPHMVEKMASWDARISHQVMFSEMLKGCDAYIATGSGNTARYFEYYFSKYPHVIRRNRTSVAILKGDENESDLDKLADDVYLYFGLGCRNVTKIYVPAGYDFIPLLDSFKKYDSLIENHKYKNNYDFNLALLMLNQKYYMTNGSILLAENPSVFSPISVLHYEFYVRQDDIYNQLNPTEIQCISGTDQIPFGSAQYPVLTDYADGKDTMKFMVEL